MSLLYRKPLTYSFLSNSNRYFPCQVRHLDLISQFTTDIRHVNFFDNTVADALSRIDIQAVNQFPPIFDFTTMTAAQATDVKLQKLRLSHTSSLKLMDIQMYKVQMSV